MNEQLSFPFIFPQQEIGQKLMEAGLTAEQVDLVDKRRFLFHHLGLSSRKYNKLLKNFSQTLIVKVKRNVLS